MKEKQNMKQQCYINNWTDVQIWSLRFNVSYCENEIDGN
jgi:hypothetical protein